MKCLVTGSSGYIGSGIVNYLRVNNIDYLENGGKFILCLPNIEIIDRNNYKVYE